jgi:hypothetical protein
MRMAMRLGVLALMAAGCGGDFSAGQKPDFAVDVEGDPKNSTTETPIGFYEFSAVTPGQGQRQLARVRIRNLGDEAFDITRVAFLENNADGTTKSPWVTIEWGSIDPAIAIPFSTTKLRQLEFNVLYAPTAECTTQANCEASGTLIIEHTDAEKLPAQIEFGPPKCRREPRVDPPKDTFFNASVARPETKTFSVTNTGSCSCAVNDVTFKDPATTKFKISRSFPNGSEIEPGTKLDFTVTYTPTDDGLGDTAVIYVSTDCRDTPLVVPLDTKSETGTYEISYDGKDEKGFLDFTTVTTGCEEKLVSLYNVGPSTMTVQGWSVPEDTAGEYYTIACQFPATTAGGTPTPVAKPPAGLAEGRTLECKVKYCANTLAGKNGTVSFSFRNPTDGVIEIPAFGGEPKSCFDFAPGDAAHLMKIDFVAAQKGDTIKHTAVIYNCGNDVLTVNRVRFENDFQQATPYFSLDGAPTFPVEVPVAGLQTLTISMTITDNEPQVGAVMYIDYLDPFGNEITSFAPGLRGVVAPTSTVPVAVAGATPDAKVGAEVVLSGLGSSPEAEIVPEGYVWYLTDKPAGSQVIVNGTNSFMTRSFIPDKAGKYTFALRVFASTEPFFYSDEATVTVDVAP